MRVSIPQGSMTPGSLEEVCGPKGTMLKNKSVLALANNRIMVGLRTFQPTLVP